MANHCPLQKAAIGCNLLFALSHSQSGPVICLGRNIIEDATIADPRLRYKCAFVKGPISAAPGNYQAAIAEFEKAIDAGNDTSSPDEVKLRVEMAEVCELCGDRTYVAGKYRKTCTEFRKLGMKESAASFKVRLPQNVEDESHEKTVADQPSKIEAEIEPDEEEEEADDTSQLSESDTQLHDKTPEQEVEAQEKHDSLSSESNEELESPPNCIIQCLLKIMRTIIGHSSDNRLDETEPCDIS
jgi:hypothetical protein